jgi:hypothetical protein
MNNAHLRLGRMSFHRTIGNTVSRFSLRMDRFIGERGDGGTGKAHFISVFGGDAQIAAVNAIVADQLNFTVDGPELAAMNVTLGKNAQCYRASIPFSVNARPVRHLIAVSEEFGAVAHSETGSRTLLAESSPDFVWASIAQIFGLPAVPEWAEWFHSKLDDHLAITPIFGLGLRPVAITGTKAEFLGWLSEGIRKEEIKLPEFNGQQVWPKITMERILLNTGAPEKISRQSL